MALSVLGAIPIGIGFMKLDEAANEEKRIIEKNQYTTVPQLKTISGNSVPFSTILAGEHISASYAFVLKTNDTFSVDNRIDYKVDLHVTRPDLIADIVLVFGVRGENYTNISIPNAELFVEQRRQLFGDTVQLFRVPNQPELFTRTGNISFPLEGDLRLHFITFSNDGGNGELPFNDPIVTINPSLAKLQADTNRATLEQIDELKESTKAQTVSNKRIEGLTWITVGAIPVLVVADILLRIYCEKTSSIKRREHHL